MFDFFKKKISSLSINLNLNEMRKYVKIVVVDDDKNSFPVELMKESGYSIDYFKKVDHNLLERLEHGSYDIIILDIMGICDEKLSLNDGVSILERIKKINPSQVVVAFSGQMFDVEKSKFWRIADDSLKKPVDLIKCKDVVDGIIKEKINPQNMWSGIKGILEARGAAPALIAKVEDSLVRAISSKKVDNIKFAELIKSCFGPVDLILSITSRIVVLFSPFIK